MAIMRLLLILALLVGALVMAGPVTAAPSGAMPADCHSMSGPDEHGEQDSDGDMQLFALHMCPGCAFMAAFPQILTTCDIPAVPGGMTRPANSAGADLAPVPPPPREA